MSVLGTVMPSPKFVGLDDDGTPLSGGLLYVYLAGTLTPSNSYTDAGLTTPNANPVVLDAAGRATVYLDEKSYKFILKRAAGSTVWTQDNVSAVHLGQTAGVGTVFPFGGDPDVYSADVAYPAGVTLDKTAAGTAVWRIDSANLIGTYRLRGVLRSGDGVITITAALVNLSDGSPDTPLTTIASTNAQGELKESGDIVFPAAGAAKDLAIKLKVSAGAGYGWGFQIVRVA